MLDGRHTGTGGGNHIVVGGPTPADSPLLRNPGLLRSLIGYWHNHPALSYLFSGLFVGPDQPGAARGRSAQRSGLRAGNRFQADSGQASRRRRGLVDRIFRNLLIDATGNTHRAEFCIDKLYSPDSRVRTAGAARNARVRNAAARADEPHAASAARSLIATFWKQPYRENLVRWRTEIHDRFMLPHFVRQDMEDVVVGPE